MSVSPVLSPERIRPALSIPLKTSFLSIFNIASGGLFAGSKIGNLGEPDFSTETIEEVF